MQRIRLFNHYNFAAQYFCSSFYIIFIYSIIWTVYFESGASPFSLVSRKLKVGISVNKKIYVNYIKSSNISTDFSICNLII